jgi:alpha-1,6-mannosyltransferase
MSSLSVAARPLRLSAPRVLATAVGVAASGALLACGMRIVVGATADPTYLVPSGRRTGYPTWMHGPFAGLSSYLALHDFLVLMSAMVVAWLVVLLLARSLPAWFLAAVVVTGTVIFALAPPLLSTDVFNYIAYGQMGLDGINPYLHGPVTLLGQPVYGYTGHLWKDVPSAYGPVFTLISYVLAPAGVAAAFWAMKAIAAASLLAIAAFVWASAKRLGRDPRLPVVLVALNPLVLVYAVGGAHNDLLMAALLAAALWLAVSKRPFAAGVVIVAAIAVKASAGLALPFLLLGARPRRRALAGVVAASVTLAAVSLLVFGTAITKMAGALAVQQRFHWIVVSVPGFVGHYAGLGVPGHLARELLTAVAAAVIVVVIVRARGGRGWIEGGAAATLVVLATTAWVLPWYVVWALPFVALVRGRAAPAAAVLLTALLMAMQLDHFVLTHASHESHAARIHAELHHARDHRLLR